ncbi:MAG: hypothetical protein ACFFBD_00325 [Candidatus Hodarchaeota archaeon]
MINRKKKISQLKVNDESQQLIVLDLTPVSQCPNLQKLNLGYNQLWGVDLSPLSWCQNQ